MRIAVVGAGMYVTGRGNSGVGTILASLAECSRELPELQVEVMARSPANAAVVRAATDRINGRLGTTLPVDYRAVGEDFARWQPGLCAEGGYDAAIVSVPDHLHLLASEGFLRSGVHCLVVKPMAPTLADARRMYRLQQASGALGMVEFHKRYDESNLYAKRLIEEGAIGQVRYFTVEYSQRVSIPRDTFRDWAKDSNIFQYLGVHYVDLIHFLTGARPLRAMAVATSGVLERQGIDSYDSVHAIVVWQDRTGADEILSQFAVNWIDPTSSTAMSDQKYTVVGSGGRLELDQKNRGLALVQEGRGLQAINPYFSDFLPGPDGQPVFQGYGQRSIATFLRDVIDVQAGRTTRETLEQRRPTFRQGLVSTAVVEAVNRSLRSEGRWCQVEDLDEPRVPASAGVLAEVAPWPLAG